MHWIYLLGVILAILAKVRNKKSYVIFKLIPVLILMIYFFPISPKLLVALFFCLLGDFFLVYNRTFLLGLVSFLFAHLAFIYLMPEIHFDSFSIAIYLIGIFYYIILAKALYEKGKKYLLIPVAFYVVVILAMVSAAWENAMMTWGAITFALSDSLLAKNRFIKPQPLLEPLILLTYYLALFLICFSF